MAQARLWAWQQDVRTLDGARLAATAALLFGGELALADPIASLVRVTPADIVIEPEVVWLFVTPSDCSDAYPIALRADTALWVVHYLVMWFSSSAEGCGGLPFAGVTEESVVMLVRSLLFPAAEISLADVVAANRAFLHTLYPAETVAYLAGHWRKVKLACPGPRYKPPARQYRSDGRGFAEHSRPLRMTLRELAREDPEARISMPLAERYLLEQAAAILTQLSVSTPAAARVPVVRAVGQIVHGPNVDRHRANALLGLLIGAELAKSKPNLSVRSLELYLGRIESWIGRAGERPLSDTGDILNSEQAARRDVLVAVARRVFTALNLRFRCPARHIGRVAEKRVEYINLPLLPLEEWLQRIEKLDLPLPARRSLQVQFLLAGELRSAALYSLTFGEILPDKAEVVLRWEKFGHPGVRQLPRTSSPLSPEITSWLARQRRLRPAARITTPSGAEEYRLSGWLARIGFGRGNSVHDVRALWCSLQYLDGFPLVGQAERMAHRHPETTLQNYVLSRHLRQRDLARRLPLAPLPCRLLAGLTGYSTYVRLMKPDTGSLPPMRGLDRLPAVCFRVLSRISTPAQAA